MDASSNCLQTWGKVFWTLIKLLVKTTCAVLLAQHRYSLYWYRNRKASTMVSMTHQKQQKLRTVILRLGACWHWRGSAKVISPSVVFAILDVSFPRDYVVDKLQVFWKVKTVKVLIKLQEKGTPVHVKSMLVIWNVPKCVHFDVV